jgi:taurine dioxygenase
VMTRVADAHGFVCEIAGLDCSSASSADLEGLERLLFEHRVVVIRGQQLSPEQHQIFMGSFGRLIPHVLQNFTVNGFPAILKISDYVRPDDSQDGVLDGGSYWHSDMSYLPELGIATSLYAVRASARSGRTSFLDLVRAWRLLSEDTRLLGLLGCSDPEEALSLEVVHRFGNRHALHDDSAARQPLSREQRRTLTCVRHRLVQRHPITGTVSLFAPSGSAMELVGKSRERSELILNQLEEMLLAYLTPYTHRYEPGDLVLWDNMSTLHRGAGVEPTHELEESRLLYRINVNYTRKHT